MDLSLRFVRRRGFGHFLAHREASSVSDLVFYGVIAALFGVWGLVALWSPLRRERKRPTMTVDGDTVRPVPGRRK